MPSPQVESPQSLSAFVSQTNMSTLIKVCSMPILNLCINGESLQREYRGKCCYKTGRCRNERALKVSSKKKPAIAHALCENHRDSHNQTQRLSDRKRKAFKKSVSMSNARQKSHSARPFISSSSHHSLSPSIENSMPLEMKWNPASPFDSDVAEIAREWKWYSEDVDILQTILVEEPMDFNPQNMFDMLPVESDF